MNETDLSAAPEQSAPAAAPEAAAPHEATEETVTVGALRGAIERRNAQRARRAAEEAAVRWSREADELTAQCPDFDLGAALKDTQFCALLRAGVDVRTAWFALHAQALLTAACARGVYRGRDGAAAAQRCLPQPRCGGHRPRPRAGDRNPRQRSGRALPRRCPRKRTAEKKGDMSMENIHMDLRLFDANTQVTTQQSLTEEMKTFYSDYLIDAAEPELVHDQFAQKHPIPANGGKTIQFRRFAPLGKALTALTEGVTPDGQSLSMTTVEAAVRQYGGYIQMSDLLLLTAIDNNLTMATKLLGAQAGRTLDTITREVLVGGDNVQYADESVSARYLLQGGNANAADNNYLTVDCIRRAVRALKNANCRRIDGAFPVIIHPDVAYDLMNDPKWLAPHQYVDTEHMYEGEIGKIEGCRFVESTEAKIFHAEDLASDSRTLLTNGAVSGKTTFSFDGGTVKSGALVGRQVLIGNACVTVTANTASSMTVDAAVTAEDNAIIYPGEAGAQGRDVYVTLVLGADGYGTTEITGGGLEHIVKQLGSAGTGDPLNQRASVGWKATKVAVRLDDSAIRRIETCSTYTE